MVEKLERRAKIFQTGRSQAVRLPKEFRFEGTEVRIRKAGHAVVLEPIGDDWQWLHELRAQLGPLDADFIAATKEEMPQQERPGLDRLFR
jgi:antitoxin VapB